MQKIRGKIPYLVFKENNAYVAYSPAIGLSTCGSTEKETRKRFEEAAQIFFDEIIKMGTIDDVLTECGWKLVTKQEKPSWEPPKYKQEFAQIAEGVA